jgi:hypothetical protein
VANNALLVGKPISAVVVQQNGIIRNIENGEITGIHFMGERAFLEIRYEQLVKVEHEDDDPRLDDPDDPGYAMVTRTMTESVPLQFINHIVEAIQLVGRRITHNHMSGMVESVTMRSGVPFLNMRVENSDGSPSNLVPVSYALYREDQNG